MVASGSTDHGCSGHEAIPNLLFADRLRVLEDGFAVDHAEEIEGQHCIGAAVLDRQGLPIGAIWITGPSARLLKKDFPELGMQIREHAEEISHTMGHFAFKVA